MRWLGLLLLCGLLGGCFRLEAWVDALDTRGVNSCVFSAGFIQPFVFTQTITATGGMTVSDCRALGLVP